MKFIPLAAVILIGAAPALAQSQQQSASAPAPVHKPKDVKPHLICEVQEEIGSRLGGTRVCHTAEEWAEIRGQTREDVQRTQQTR